MFLSRGDRDLGVAFQTHLRSQAWYIGEAKNSALLSPGGSDGKESVCNAGGLCSFPGLGRSPGGGHGNPLQYSCLENPRGQRSLEGYSPWGRKEMDMTERLSTVQHIPLYKFTTTYLSLLLFMNSWVVSSF